MISIAMATYNGSSFLEEQLNSIILQTYNNFELHICDDCSKDNTLDILKKYAEKDSRIFIHENSQNMGFKKNFEKAVSFCNGEYIAFCDQDDIWTYDHLEILLNTIKNKDLACGNAILIDSNNNEMGITTLNCLSNFNFPENQNLLFKNLLYSNFAQGTAMLISKNIINKVFPIPETVTFHDWWAAYIATLNNGCAYTNKIILKYRQHGNNVTTTKPWKIRNAIHDTLNNRKKLYSEYIKKIEITKLLYNLTDNSENIKSLNDCITYYDNFLKHKRIKNIHLFIKNYKSIYWTRKPNFFNFLLRFLKIFILHL